MPCLDCKCPDDEMPLDTVITGKQWERICPEGGVLCASCIVKRAAKLPHVINLTARITFADDFKGDAPGGEFFQFLKACDANKERLMPEWAKGAKVKSERREEKRHGVPLAGGDHAGADGLFDL